MSNNVADKYIGTLLCGCYGDILGSQTKRMTPDMIKKKFGGVIKEMPVKKLYTDDTEMTLVLARHLIKNKQIITNDLHNEYSQEIKDKDYSLTTRNILTQFKNNPNIGNIILPGNSDCSGAVMCIAPLGLMKLNFESLLRGIREAVLYTHGNNEGAIYSAFLHCTLIIHWLIICLRINMNIL